MTSVKTPGYFQKVPPGLRLFGLHLDRPPRCSPNSQFAIQNFFPCLFPAPGYTGRMEVSESIQCPFCGQRFDLMVDTGVPAQRFTTDCEICCRPFEVAAECEPGEILSLEVFSG